MDHPMDTDEPQPVQGQFYGHPQHVPQSYQGSTTEPPPWMTQFMQLMSQFTTQNNTPNASSTATVQSELNQKRPRHTQPHPDKFTNTDNSQYPQFRSLLEAKLRIDAKAIGNEEERVWYGFGRLTDIAAGRIHPWIQYAQGTPEFTVEGLLNQMDQAFADPQKRAKALDKINRIRQGNRDFRTFLQEFEQTLLEARGWGWADEVKKGYLKAGLNRELCDRLVTQVEPDLYTEFTTQLRTISDKLQQIKSWDDRRTRNRVNNSYDSHNTQLATDSMDWEPTRTTSAAATGRLYQSQQKRARWVEQAEIGQRMSNGSCLRCGRQGHLVRGCNLLPAKNPHKQTQVQRQSAREEPEPRAFVRKPQVVAAIAPKSKTVTVTDIEEVEEWETDEESGKE